MNLIPFLLLLLHDQKCCWISQNYITTGTKKSFSTALGFQCKQCNGGLINRFRFIFLLFVELDFYISDPARDSESDRHLEDWEWDSIEAALWSVTLLLLSPCGIPWPVWSHFGGSEGESLTLGTAEIKDRNCLIVSKSFLLPLFYLNKKGIFTKCLHNEF